jgi:hypothetical protein
MIVIGKTTKGYWPRMVSNQVVSYKSHPYAMKMNSDYFVALAKTFEEHYGVEFVGIRNGAVTDPRERLLQFKTNIDVVMSVLDRNGLGDWLAERLVKIGDTVKDEFPMNFDLKADPFLDDRLRVANLPETPQIVNAKNRLSGDEKQVAITLFRKPGEMAGTRRAISEIFKWLNYVTDNRFLTLAADLSESINLEHGNLWGHYDPETNPLGTRIKAAIQEAGNVATAIGWWGRAPVSIRTSSQASGPSAVLTARSRRSCIRPPACGASRIRTAGSAWACCTFWRGTPDRKRRRTDAPTSGFLQRRSGNCSRAAKQFT